MFKACAAVLYGHAKLTALLLMERLGVVLMVSLFGCEPVIVGKYSVVTLH